MLDLLSLLENLIAKPSITPLDEGCQTLIAQILESIHFKTQFFPKNHVNNLWAKYGESHPLLVFAGHTDVVSPGDINAWSSSPFEPTVRDGYLYGRGAADMKSSLAAMLVAAERFIHTHPNFRGSIGFLITSGEEGTESDDGTPHVMASITEQGEKVDACIVGEPSSEKQLGDTLKVGRRGSLTGYLTIHGKQGHVAYPHKAENPIHQSAKVVHTLVDTLWDKGNKFFPPTSFQITSIQADAGGNNVIPGTLKINFNFRYSPESHHEELQKLVTRILKNQKLNFSLEWQVGGLPFLSKQGPLLKAMQKSLKTVCDIQPELSTAGGTSDARFIAPYDVEVIEFGPSNKTIHQIDECIEIEELYRLVRVYESILENFFQPAP